MQGKNSPPYHNAARILPPCSGGVAIAPIVQTQCHIAGPLPSPTITSLGERRTMLQTLSSPAQTFRHSASAVTASCFHCRWRIAARRPSNQHMYGSPLPLRTVSSKLTFVDVWKWRVWHKFNCLIKVLQSWSNIRSITWLDGDTCSEHPYHPSSSVYPRGSRHGSCTPHHSP